MKTNVIKMSQNGMKHAGSDVAALLNIKVNGYITTTQCSFECDQMIENKIKWPVRTKCILYLSSARPITTHLCIMTLSNLLAGFEQVEVNMESHPASYSQSCTSCMPCIWGQLVIIMWKITFNTPFQKLWRYQDEKSAESSARADHSRMWCLENGK